MPRNYSAIKAKMGPTKVDKHRVLFNICHQKEALMHKVLVYSVVICIVAAISCGERIIPTLKLEKTEFAPGEEIALSFTAPKSCGEKGWVGIIPSSVPHGDENVNDDNDIAYLYINKQTSGVMNFKAPGKPGAYDFRMHDTDENGKEVASISFQVKLVTEGAGFTLEKTTYVPGEEIRLAFTAPATFGTNAWIGIIPADVPHGSEDENDRFDVDYQYLNKRTQGLLIFKAPEKPGKYDFRMHDTDDNGNEVTYIGFTVE
jgi:hypothetical protein